MVDVSIRVIGLKLIDSNILIGLSRQLCYTATSAVFPAVQIESRYILPLSLPSAVISPGWNSTVKAGTSNRATRYVSTAQPLIYSVTSSQFVNTYMVTVSPTL